MRDKLCHVGVGVHQEPHVHDVGVEHHLVDVAGGDDLLVDDGADVQTLCHAHIVDVLHRRHGLAHTHALGCETSQDVGLGVACERHKRLCVLYSLVDEERNVASVAVDDEHARVVYDVVQAVAPCLVGLDDLHVHIFGHGLHRSHRRCSATHDHDVLDVNIMFLAHNLADVRDILFCRHEIGEVIELQRVVTARYDGVGSAFYGHHMIGVVGSAEVFKWLVQDLATFAQLDAEHHERPVVNVPPLSHPRHLKTVVYVFTGQKLRVDERTDAETCEKLLLFGFNIFGVVNLCDRLLCSQSLGQHTGCHVKALIGCDGNEQVCRCRSCLA